MSFIDEFNKYNMISRVLLTHRNYQHLDRGKHKTLNLKARIKAYME
jgi:hypothetical protein